MVRELKSVDVEDFIASWSDIVADFKSGAGSGVDVTQDGAIVAHIRPARQSLHGYLRGTVHNPSGADLTAPAFDGDTHAEGGRIHE